VDVLVIEHEYFARKTLCEELSRLSSIENVRSAASEEASEQVLSYFRPDIIYLDMELPDSGAFRIADRSWAPHIPVIICMTTFQPSLVAALNKYRVEYLVRPIRTEELTYVTTRGRRPDPIDPAENLKRILDAATSMKFPVRSRIRVFRREQPVVIETKDIVAVRYDRGRFRLWTRGGIFEMAQPLDEILNGIGLSSFRRVSPNAMVSTDEGQFGDDIKRARWWLRRGALVDFALMRPRMPDVAGHRSSA
jgi:DNA-binding LytR/AlgR family response regulator